MVDIAYSLIGDAFKGKFDKGGVAYVKHCTFVGNKVAHLGVAYEIAGLLHDLVEDTSYTIADLYHLGFNHEVCNAVDALTHKQGDSYEEYIKIISGNEIARAVKKADLTHNSDITRMKGCEQKDLDRVSKYHRAFNYLQDYPKMDRKK